MMDTSTKGTAINFNKLMKIVPKGAIQSTVKELHPKELDTRAQTIPKISPIIIFQCSDSFFIQRLFFGIGFYEEIGKSNSLVQQIKICQNKCGHGLYDGNSTWNYARI